MTLKRMYALTNLQEDINERLEHMQQLEAIATKVTPSIGGGGGSGISDKVGKNAAEIADLRTEVEELNDRCVAELVFLQRYVNAIDDVLTRRIISLRFINRLSWYGVARKIGGGNTEESIKKIAYRYLKLH